MMTVAQSCYHYTSGQEENTSQSAYTQESMNLVFANQDDEDAIYPLTYMRNGGTTNARH